MKNRNDALDEAMKKPMEETMKEAMKEPMEETMDEVLDEVLDETLEEEFFASSADAVHTSPRHWTGICEEDGARLDSYLAAHVEGLSRSRVAQLVTDGKCLVEGKIAKPGLKLKGGQSVDMTIPADVILAVLPQDLPLHIVYEDEDILIVDKAKGMVVHPAPGHPDGTLVNALMFHCGSRLSDINGVIRPGIVHRIDRDTSGLLVVAKNNAAHRRLSEDLSRHDIERTYLAVIDGRLGQDEGTVDLPIGRHPVDRKRMSIRSRSGRHAVTHYRVLQRFRANTLVECRLETGRTHQIRVHMASLGHPVTGDTVYGKPYKGMDTQGQALHACRLKLVHPASGEPMVFETVLPAWASQLLEHISHQ